MIIAFIVGLIVGVVGGFLGRDKIQELIDKAQ